MVARMRPGTGQHTGYRLTKDDDKQSVHFHDKDGTLTYKFDVALDGEDKKRSVFDVLVPLLQEALNGGDVIILMAGWSRTGES